MNMKGKAPQPVIAYEPSGIRTFPSVSEASKHYGLSHLTVYKLIRSGQATTNGVGFDWVRF